jgi:hypothetical protein
MTISAKIIADSISPQRIRLTTMQLRYPRFIHAEFMTHRVFSRNASSSRAIPVKRLIQDVIDDPAMPLHWGKNQPGMQAKEEHDGEVQLPVQVVRHSGTSFEAKPHSAQDAWFWARHRAIQAADAFDRAGYHKQIVNRLLEPFSHINVLVTATEYDNFFALRDHPDAQPEIRMLAQAMQGAMDASKPEPLWSGMWHLPYVSAEERSSLSAAIGLATMSVDEIQKTHWAVSVARCARVSYLTQEGKTPTLEEDLALYDRLLASVPLHASPAEHQATPDQGTVRIDGGAGPQFRKPYLAWHNFEKHGNLRGWIQFRKTLSGENQAQT